MSLHVTIALRPGGDDGREERLAEVEIENVSRTHDTADYRVSVVYDDGAHGGRVVLVSGHRREKGAIALVARALAAAARCGEGWAARARRRAGRCTP